MTILTWYVFVGLPLILAAMMYAGFRVIDRDARALDVEQAKAAEKP